MSTVQQPVVPSAGAPASATPSPVADAAHGVGTDQGPASTIGTLLRLVAQEDVQAFDELYALTSGRVYGLVRRTLADTELSAEITQDVYLAVWQTGAARFDPRLGSGLSWIMTLAHRRAVDRVRSEDSLRSRHLRWSSKNQDVDYDQVADTVIQRSESAAVRACLPVLSPKQREAIDLAYYAGLTYAEVAERLGIPIPTAKTRIRDGILRLRKTLEVEH